LQPSKKKRIFAHRLEAEDMFIIFGDLEVRFVTLSYSSELLEVCEFI
jgi:hypothetical protein